MKKDKILTIREKKRILPLKIQTWTWRQQQWWQVEAEDEGIGKNIEILIERRDHDRILFFLKETKDKVKNYDELFVIF